MVHIRKKHVHIDILYNSIKAVTQMLINWPIIKFCLSQAMAECYLVIKRDVLLLLAVIWVNLKRKHDSK